MNDTTTFIPWVAISVFTVYAVIPAITGMLHQLCYWLDDGEKTFKYPSLVKFGFPYFARRDTRTWDVHDFVIHNCMLIGILGSLIGVFLDAFRLKHPEIFWPAAFSAGVLFVVLLFIKKGLKLKKAFDRHIKDKKAHM